MFKSLVNFINPKSVGKAGKDLAISVGTIGALAGLTALQDPELLAPFAASLGPFGVIALLGIKSGVSYLKDRLKHGPAESEDDYDF